MQKVSAWINALRIKTLILAFSNVLVANAISFYDGHFKLTILIFGLLTAVTLQILSNLANDYGDFKKGTDNLNRVGPLRALQSGIISLKEMKFGIIFFILISLVFGVLLIYFAFNNLIIESLLFFLIGVLAISSALFYTIGKKAYGYSGFGDIFVFTFFGLVAILGNYYLQTLNFNFYNILPAFSFGFLSVIVLNINNMRDIENDKLCDKNTIPVKIGIEKSIIYHNSLLICSIILSSLFLLFRIKIDLVLILFLVINNISLKFFYLDSIKIKTIHFNNFLKLFIQYYLVFTLLFSFLLFYNK